MANGKTSFRPRSKRALASDDVEHAISSCSKALSRLGGRVRHGAKKLPPDSTYQARQYLEGIISRLAIAKLLIDTIEKKNVTLRDEFEMEYDRTRDPQC